MVAILCALLSGAGFYFSIGLGGVWPLAWLAPVPMLWLAFGGTRGWIVFAAAWCALALGALNILPAYWGILPAVALAAGIAMPALGFAGCAIGARFVAQRVHPHAGILAFAALWTSWDYLASFDANGTAASPAYSQVGAPWLVQGASVFGLWFVTFTLGFVAAGLALALRRQSLRAALLALALFAANAGFGMWRMGAAQLAPETRIGLAADDSHETAGFVARRDLALAAVDAYAAAAHGLAAAGARLIVFPEKVAVLESAWREEAIARLRKAAQDTRATIVIGFDDRLSPRRNDALIFTADGAPPELYAKRHMVPGLENVFVPGAASFMLPDRTGVAICKDMDFPATLRADADAHPTLLAVPAWDFDQDRWWHARLAITRGVEDGFALARAAKDGLLTLSDAYGRATAMKRSSTQGMVTLVGDLAAGPGETIYARIGDVFAWACLAAAALLLGMSFARRALRHAQGEEIT